jgi:hypothetical protein
MLKELAILIYVNLIPALPAPDLESLLYPSPCASLSPTIPKAPVVNRGFCPF